eukprot:384463-Alexandrium_andersonii.AAC.1
MLTRLGARSARGHGGGAAVLCGTRGITCGWPSSAGADSAHRTQGTGTKPCRTSWDQRSPRGRRTTALTLRASWGLTAT